MAMPEMDTEMMELVNIQDHPILHHPMTDTQGVDKSLGDRDEFKNWNSPNKLKQRNLQNWKEIQESISIQGRYLYMSILMINLKSFASMKEPSIG